MPHSSHSNPQRTFPCSIVDDAEAYLSDIQRSGTTEQSVDSPYITAILTHSSNSHLDVQSAVVSSTWNDAT